MSKNSAQEQKYVKNWRWRRGRPQPLSKRELSRQELLRRAGEPPSLTALADWHLELIKAMTPEQLRRYANEAWINLWRNAMLKVGGKSLL